MSDLPGDVRTLFKAPFATDKQQVERAGGKWPLGHAVFVQDADGHMASSTSRGTSIPRGWGRHQYLPEGEHRHDAWCAWFTANVPEGSTLDDVARILNEAWGVTP